MIGDWHKNDDPVKLANQEVKKNIKEKKENNFILECHNITIAMYLDVLGIVKRADETTSWRFGTPEIWIQAVGHCNQKTKVPVIGRRRPLEVTRCKPRPKKFHGNN